MKHNKLVEFLANLNVKHKREDRYRRLSGDGSIVQSSNNMP